MKTLIFKTVGKPNSNSTKPEFVKEGTFTDAMTHFDYEYPTFFYELGDEGYNEEIADGANWYYTDSNADLIVRDLDLIDNEEWENNIDNTFFRSYYTKNINNLSDDELKEVLKQNWLTDSFKEEVIESNGMDYTTYQVAKYFRDSENYLDNPETDYLEKYYNKFDEEQEEDYIEVNGKFYTKF